MSDYNFQEQKVGQKANAQKIDNQHFDEALELSGDGSEILSDQDREQGSENEDMMEKPVHKVAGRLGAPLNESHDSDERVKIIPNEYNPDEYAHLNVSSEIKELFKYITRFTPREIELETKLKVFIPEYIPTIGEVDGYLKMERPETETEELGLVSLDEPALNQSKKAKLDLMMREMINKRKENKSVVVHSIENAAKNPKEIMSWINDVSDLHKKKQAPSISYSKPMPEIDALMQVWPSEIEEAFQALKLPTEELDFSLEDFSKLACLLVDIPVHSSNTKRNLIESLHVFFTLFSEFKANQHFMQPNQEVYDNQQTWQM